MSFLYFKGYWKIFEKTFGSNLIEKKIKFERHLSFFFFTRLAGLFDFYVRGSLHLEVVDPIKSL